MDDLGVLCVMLGVLVPPLTVCLDGFGRDVFAGLQQY
jgi:uncharacterized membrane protein YqaE (UPF0057 family)